MKIRRQEGYLLQSMGNKTYLLPYGQKIADQKRGMECNETAQFLWEMLQAPMEMEELVERVAAYYEVPEEQMPELQADIEGFVQQLEAFGAVRHELGFVCEKYACRLEIAEIRIDCYGEMESIPQQFSVFRIERNAGKAPQLVLELCKRPPESHQNGQILIRNRDLTVCQWEEGFVLWFPALPNIYEIWMKEDGSYARIYYRDPMQEEEKDALFLAIRPVFLLLAQRQGKFAVHSASLLYREKAWLFSGPSGMGKSTHTKLWEKLFHTPMLNGDLNLCGKEGNRFVVYGIPWCGTSEIYTTEKHDLGGIVLLEKAPEEELVSLSQEQKALRVMQRIISPPWTAGMMQSNLEFAKAAAKARPIYFLKCTKEDSAAEVMCRKITEDDTAADAAKEGWEAGS